jgi:copper chaperone CopZ
MQIATLSVPDITCGHCEKTITNALSPLEGAQSVRVDIPAKQVTLVFDETRLSLDRVREILSEEDYPVESVVSAAA